MTIQSAVACSEAKDDGLLVSLQPMECVLVWVISYSLAVEDGFLFNMDKKKVMFPLLIKENKINENKTANLIQKEEH